MVLRCWRPEDAPLLCGALEQSRAELEVWTPWVLDDAHDEGATRTRLQGYASDFEAGESYLYAIMDREESEVWGGVGLYRRVGPDALEIGYWVRSDRTGRGLATDAAAALVSVAAEMPGIRRLEIHCRSDNEASLRIPIKLGFTRRGSMAGTPDRPGEAEVWELPLV